MVWSRAIILTAALVWGIWPATVAATDVCQRQDPKGMHVQVSLTGAPIIFYDLDVHKSFVSIAATPEMRFKADLGCWPFFFVSGGWTGLSQLVYGGQNVPAASNTPQLLEEAPVHVMVGLGLDVPKTGEHMGATTSLGSFVFGVGYGNFKIGENRLASGPAILVGFVSSLVTLNFPYQEGN